MNELKIQGHEIRAKHCTAYKVRIISKDFQNTVICDPFAFYDEAKSYKGRNNEPDYSYKESGIILTEDKILHWVNKANSIGTHRTGEGELQLIIDTEHYKIVVVLEAVKREEVRK